MRSIAVLGNSHAGVFVLGENRVNALFPKSFPGGPFKAHEMSLQCLHVAGILAINSVSRVTRYENLVADNNRTGHARSGKSNLPLQILFVAEGYWQWICVGADTRPIGTSETFPVSRVADCQ